MAYTDGGAEKWSALDNGRQSTYKPFRTERVKGLREFILSNLEQSTTSMNTCSRVPPPYSIRQHYLGHILIKIRSEELIAKWHFFVSRSRFEKRQWFYCGNKLCRTQA